MIAMTVTGAGAGSCTELIIEYDAEKMTLEFILTQNRMFRDGAVITVYQSWIEGPEVTLKFNCFTKNTPAYATHTNFQARVKQNYCAWSSGEITVVEGAVNDPKATDVRWRITEGDYTEDRSGRVEFYITE